MENKGVVLMQRYELGKLLGQGTFAKVHHAKNLKTGNSVAIKIIDKEKVLKVGMIEQIKREISVMRVVRHPHIVELYEVMASKTKIYFVMEFVRGGELFGKVAKGRLKEDAARKYFQQLISAVDFCHTRGVYHRDLKPENLLLDENGNLKVSDFGLSAFAECKHQDGLLHTTCGTPAYVAPEVISRKGYDGSKADIWSCGVILFVLLAGYLPFRESNLMEMYRKIGKAEFKFPKWFTPDVRHLLSKILDPNPNSRVSIAKITENPWFMKGLESTTKIVGNVGKELQDLEVDCVFKLHSGDDENLELEKPSNLNAFDIIAFSPGFNLSGLFEENDWKREFRFTSKQTAKAIILKLEKIAESLGMKVVKKDRGLLKMEGSRQGRKGVLSIDAEVFEVSPTFHLIELKKAGGDTLEYRKILHDDMRPALKDIEWTWQEDQARHQQQQQGHEVLAS